MIRIDKQTMVKLERYASKRALAEKLFRLGNDVAGFDVYDEEFFTLQTTLVQEFLPLVTKLVESGIIEVGIDGDGEKFTGFVSGDAVSCFENGNINLHAAKISCSMDRPLMQDD